MNWKVIVERFKSPIVWFGLVATILSAAQISPENLTSWDILGANLLAFVSNPFLLGTAVVMVFAYINNPSDKEKF